MRHSIVLLIILIFAGCQSAPKPPAADTERLADAYVSVLRLKARLGADTTLTAARYDEQVKDSLRVRGYDREEFQRQMDALSRSADDIRRFSERVQTLMAAR